MGQPYIVQKFGYGRLLIAGTLITLLLFILPLRNSLSPSIRSSTFSRTHHLTQAGDSIYSHVANSTLGFERIYVLNLPERTDKKDGMVLQAAVSNIKLDFIDGVKVDAITEKILPIKHEKNYKETWVAAWRAHANALSEIVRLNLSSALIMEDDIDWDVSLKDILYDVAVSSSALSGDTTGSERDIDKLSATAPSQISPYGNDWDLIWLGHCGTHISDKESRVVKYNDPTVPQPQYLHSWDPNELTPLAIYPNHTRLVGHLTDGTCSLAYAVSLQGARKLLYDIGILHLDMGFDLMLGAFCSGNHGRKKHNCYGVLPPVFEHYRRAGLTSADSDLHDLDGNVREKGFTMNLRHTVALNMDKILEGATDYRDQYPDT